jgi:cytochrome b6
LNYKLSKPFHRSSTQRYTGGGAVNTETVEHLYTLHSYVVSTGAIILAIIHLWGILRQEKEMLGSLAAMPDVELKGKSGKRS